MKRRWLVDFLERRSLFIVMGRRSLFMEGWIGEEQFVNI